MLIGFAVGAVLAFIAGESEVGPVFSTGFGAALLGLGVGGYVAFFGAMLPARTRSFVHAGVPHVPMPEQRQRPAELEFPAWDAAPPSAAKIGQDRPYSGYSRENALRALERSNVDRSRPQDRDQAAHLLKYLSWAIKDEGRARAFLEDAARDENLPKAARSFYIHAAQLAG